MIIDAYWKWLSLEAGYYLHSLLDDNYYYLLICVM